MEILITGATGMIGGLVQDQCLNSPKVSRVTSLLRRPSGVSHEKLEEVIIEDFSNLDEQAPYFKKLDTVFYCQGVYSGAVDRELFRAITVDYPKNLAEIIVKNSPKARFCLLSGGGADRSEKSRVAFAKDKGVIENHLSTMQLGAFHTFRPGYIYPVTPRDEPGFGYKVIRMLYPLIKLFGKNASIRSTDLAQALFTIGIEGSDREVFENRDMVALLG